MNSIRRSSTQFRFLLLATGAALALASGCSVRKLAALKIADTLAGRGTVFASDEDPDLVREALPFSLKLMESVLEESPEHPGLLLATASGFAQYAYAFVQQDADELESKDFAAAERLHGRARRLFLRARNYGLRSLEVMHPGFRRQLDLAPREAVAVARKGDVPRLYWTAVAWAAAIANGKDDAMLVGEIPQMEALIDRALELDESWDFGAIHGFLINYEMIRTGAEGEPETRARRHFYRARELAAGRLAGPYVNYAEAVCVEKQDVRGFREALQSALTIDANTFPEYRLANLVMQRRARWLLSLEEDLFLSPAPPAPKMP